MKKQIKKIIFESRIFVISKLSSTLLHEVLTSCTHFSYFSLDLCASVGHYGGKNVPTHFQNSLHPVFHPSSLGSINHY